MKLARLVVGAAAMLVLAAVLTPLAALLKGTVAAETVIPPHHARLLGHSLAVGLTTTLFATMFGVPVGRALSAARGRRRVRLSVATLLPLVLPPFISAVAWIELLNGGGAPPFTAHGLLAQTGLSTPALGVLEASWVLALSLFPCVSWPLCAALSRQSRELRDEARLVADLRTVARHVTWPQVATSVLLGAAVVFMLAITDFGVTDLFQCPTYPRAVFMELQLSGNAHLAARVAAPLLIMLGLVVLLITLAARRMPWEFEVDDSPLAAQSAPRSSCPVLLLGLGVPLVSLVWNGWSRAAWRNLSATVLAAQIWNSMQFALAAALMSVTAAMVIALFVERWCPRWRGAVYALSVAPLAVPAPLFAAGVMAVTTNTDWRDTFVPLAFANAARWLPLALVPMVGVLRLADRAAEDAAQLDGETSWRAPLRVTMLPSIVTLAGAGLLVFALSLGDVALASLLYPPGGQPLAVAIFDAMHYAHEPEVAVMCLVLVGLVSAATVAAFAALLSFAGQKARPMLP